MIIESPYFVYLKAINKDLYIEAIQDWDKWSQSTGTICPNGSNKCQTR